jgi:predicted nucleotidyltransferase
MNSLRELANQLGADERTLRRGVECGLVRAERVSARRTLIPASERVYLQRHWPLLSRLRRALRTEPNVALAAVFGSVARGHDHDDSDIDLLVKLRDDDAFRAADLEARLSMALGRDVQAVRLGSVDPVLLADALRDGRVLVDRERVWPRLKARRHRIDARARAERAKLRREAAEAARELISERYPGSRGTISPGLSGRVRT